MPLQHTLFPPLLSVPLHSFKPLPLFFSRTMHFPSLAIVASLACAAFSAALPVAVADPPAAVSDALTNLKSELHHYVPRDVPKPPPAPASPPAAPSPPSTPTPPETPSVTIVDVLQSLLKGLTPLVDELGTFSLSCFSSSNNISRESCESQSGCLGRFRRHSHRRPCHRRAVAKARSVGVDLGQWYSWRYLNHRWKTRP